MSYWKVGHLIQRGKYVIEKVLGAGGAGVTYRAKDTKTGNVVAIKTLNSMIQAQPDFTKHQERFIQEAFRLAKSSHPHVIRVDDVCQEAELWCMVMEYIDGGNLESLARQNNGLSPQEAIKYIEQIGSALTYIHEHGILHRDVKPANIMRRTETDEAVLIDFGLARDFIEDKTQIHTNSRTEGFAPIEQYMRSARRGAYTDVYALAGTLYYLLTMQIPFPAQFRNQGISLVPPKQHNHEISDQINYAILKGMELQPENRPQSVSEWLSLLSGKTEISLSDISAQEESANVTVVEETPVTPPPSKPKKNNPMMAPLPLPPLPKTRARKVRRIRRATDKTPTNYDPLSPSRFAQHSSDAVQSPSEVNIIASQITEMPFEYQTEEITIEEKPTEKKLTLSSAVGIDYQPLKGLLKEQKWQEADQKTIQLMLKAVGKNESEYLDRNTIKQFPCEDLKIIDQLWLKYSRGRFGFSVQKLIYQSLGGKRTYDKKTWEATGNKVGWRVNDIWLFKEDLTYDLTAPQGHLPSLLSDKSLYTLISRAMDCGV